MLQIIPTYEVVVNTNGHGDWLLNVPQDKLMALLEILWFNGITDFNINPIK